MYSYSIILRQTFVLMLYTSYFKYLGLFINITFDCLLSMHKKSLCAEMVYTGAAAIINKE